MFDRPAKIEYLPIAPERRVLVIADVHGNLPYLRGVLELASFGGDDLVIFDGDFLEKGPQSLETLRFVMALGKGRLRQLRRLGRYLFDERARGGADPALSLLAPLRARLGHVPRAGDRPARRRLCRRQGRAARGLCRRMGLPRRAAPRHRERTLPFRPRRRARGQAARGAHGGRAREIRQFSRQRRTLRQVADRRPLAGHALPREHRGREPDRRPRAAHRLDRRRLRAQGRRPAQRATPSRERA